MGGTREEHLHRLAAEAQLEPLGLVEGLLWRQRIPGGELGCRLTPGWEISAGYTQLGITGDRGTNVRTYVPRRTLHLSTSYRVPALRGLKVGANLRWQDAITRDQGVLDTQGREIVTRQAAYALLGLMARYDFDPSWSATLNVDNVTNRKYLTSLYWDQAYYGAPRHYSLNVTWRF